MTKRGGHGQFCPVSMAADVFCTRWTALVLRELMCGTTRFTDIRKGMPRLSPTLLSKRLKELEEAGVVETLPRADGNLDYRLSEMGRELGPIVVALGTWGQRWVESDLSLRQLDPAFLMWDIRRRIDPQAMPQRRCTIQFQYPELVMALRNWWLVVEDGTVDLCSFDPGHELDLLVSGSLRAMTAVWMGLSPLATELAARRLVVDGSPVLAASMARWLCLSVYAAVPRRIG